MPYSGLLSRCPNHCQIARGHVRNFVTSSCSACLRLRQRHERHLAGIDPEFAVFNLEWIHIQTARWRTRGARAIRMEGPAMTRAHEKLRFREPPHRTTQMGAVSRKYLKRIPRQMSDPTWHICGRTVGRLAKRVLIHCQPCLIGWKGGRLT